MYNIDVTVLSHYLRSGQPKEAKIGIFWLTTYGKPLNLREARNSRLSAEGAYKMAKFNDVTVGQMEACINRLGGMQKFLEFIGGKGQIVWQTVATIYVLIVDYTMNLADMISAGKYGWVDPEIVEKNFSTQKSGNFMVNAQLLHFGKAISMENALIEMEERGFRPGTLEELLSFGANYPEVQMVFHVCAFGSTCVVRETRYVPCLRKEDGKRRLDLHEVGFEWHGHYRFLVVRK